MEVHNIKKLLFWWRYYPDFLCNKRFISINCVSDFEGDRDIFIQILHLWKETEWSFSFFCVLVWSDHIIFKLDKETNLCYTWN